MPSKLLSTAASYLSSYGNLRARSKAAVAQVTPGVQTLQVRGPFLGYQPDIDPNLTDGTAFTELSNVLAHSTGNNHGEVLGLPDGFRQLDPARLPLGAAGHTGVCRIDQLVRFAPTAHPSAPGEHDDEYQITPMTVIGGDGVTGGSGLMYRLASNAQWVEVAPSAATDAGMALKATRDGREFSLSMADSCAAPFGATARATTTAAPGDDGQSGPIQEPCWIYTNDVDEVMVFPSSSVETLAATHTYEPLTNLAALDSGTAGFLAKSCETWNGRVYFLNTSEAGVRFNQRLRRTAKFTADPDPALTGAGHYDFREFQGDGLRIETLGDLLAVYFSDGIALLRPTGVPTSPDEVQVISTERGLLGTHGLTAMGRGVHFGVFTDGWWLLDPSGRWQELGVVNLDGKVVPKWRQSFYGNLPPDQRHRLYVYYDQPNNLVYIAKPTVDHPDPTEVWIYDPTSDRVFIENYPVTCFGTATPPARAGVQIDDLPGTIDELPGTIDSYGPVAGYPRVRIHGDTTGYLYQHRRDLVGYDSAASPPVVQDPAWLWALGLRSPAGFRNLTTVDRVTLEYFNHNNTGNVSVQVYGPVADGAQTRSVVLNGGALEDLRTRDAWFRYSSQSPGLRVSGTGEFHMRGTAIDLWADPHEVRGT